MLIIFITAILIVVWYSYLSELSYHIYIYINDYNEP